MNNTIDPKDLRALRRHRRRLIRRLTGLGIIIVILLIWLWPHYRFIFTGTSKRPSVVSEGQQNSGQLPKGTPDFPTVTPGGESAETFGGWTRVSPENAEPVYAFADKIQGVSIIVSEQSLPDAFATDTSTKLADFAKSYSANRVIQTGNKTTVYIGTSAKGPQSLILSKNNLLILIKSNTALNDEQWSAYIDKLK
jgi:hypothetical protein